MHQRFVRLLAHCFWPTEKRSTMRTRSARFFVYMCTGPSGLSQNDRPNGLTRRYRTMNTIEKLTRFLVRVVLAGACVMPMASLSLQAQSAPAAKTSGVEYNSRFDFATLYSYFQAHGADTDVGISYNNIRLGAYASGSYYFNRRIGLEAAFEAHPDGNNDGLYDIQAGPIIRDNMN